MDDPWANAWGDPPKQDLDQLTTSTPRWSNPPVISTSVNADEEADIAKPSWATGASIQWDEPSDSHTSLWKRESLPSTVWDLETSTYNDIPIGKTPSEESNLSFPANLAYDINERSPSCSPQSSDHNAPEEGATIPHDDSDLPNISSRATTPEPADTTLDSPDAFGTFETGIETNDTSKDPWSPSRGAFIPSSTDTGGWDSAWAAADSESEGEKNDELVDEWQQAKEQKEKQDLYVPPELLADILRRFEQISAELWSKTDKEKYLSSMNADRIDGPDASQLGISTLMNRLVPEGGLTVPSNTPFPKSFISKHASEALRLTRHSLITRSSPMAIYAGSKGSTSWEAAVKSRPEITNDDFAPPGWRIIEKEKQDAVVDDSKKKSSGLLSFFGRRAPPTDSVDSRPSSPARPSSATPTTAASKSSDTPRHSMDSAKSVVLLENIQSALPSPSRSSFTAINPSDHSQKTTDSVLTSPVTSEVGRTATPPPSAVSRFLGRFSRTKPNVGTRNSLALSSNDLEFLSDIVPTAAEKPDNSLKFDALTSMIQSSPLPTKLPPPLAPPPRLPQLKHSQSSATKSDQGALGARTTDRDNLASLFDSGPSLLTHIPGPATLLPSEVKPTSQDSLNASLVFDQSKLSSMPIKQETSISAVNTPHGTSSKDHTWSSFDTLMPHTPRSQTPAITAMHNSSLSIPTISSVPSLLPTPPAPPLSTEPVPFGKAIVSSISAISPRSRAESPLPPLPSSTVSMEEDDDFSDFLSSPADPRLTQNTFDSSFPPTFSNANGSGKSLVISNTSSMFDDFEDFQTAPLTLRTPSPPRPPAKPDIVPIAPPPRMVPIIDSVQAISPLKQKPPRKVSRAADHQRTLSLMENAAARGKWPAPPSPLPEALPPPTSSIKPNMAEDIDYFSGISTMRDQQSNALADISSSISSPAALRSQPRQEAPSQWKLLPPPNGSMLQPITSSIPTPSFQSSLGAKPIPSNGLQLPTPSSTKSVLATSKTGGLSAQDLSFFEGL